MRNPKTAVETVRLSATILANSMKRRIVAILDTNILLRYLLKDDPTQFPAALALILGAPSRSLYVPTVIIAEIIWYFHSRLTPVPRSSIVAALQQVLANKSIRFDPVLLNTVERYANTNLDFADCLIAARGVDRSLPVSSYDRGFRKFKDVVVKSPTQLLAELGLGT